MKQMINPLEIVIGFIPWKIYCIEKKILRCPKGYGYIDREICVSKKKKTCRDIKNE